VMLNTQPGVTPTALTCQDANLWPEDAAVGCWRLSWRANPTSFPGLGAHSSLPSSLLEEAFAAIRTLLDEPPTQPHEADLYEALRVYVCGAVVPFLYLIWKQHFAIEVDSPPGDAGTPPSQRACWGYTSGLAKRLYEWEVTRCEGEGRRDQGYICVMEELLEAVGQGDFVHMQRKARKKARDQAAITPQAYFKEGFTKFVTAMAVTLEIEEPEGRQIGTGLRDLALLLTQDVRKPVFEDTERRVCGPKPRHVIYQLYQTLNDRALRYSETPEDADLARNMLRVARCCIYLDDPHLQRDPGFMGQPSHEAPPPPPWHAASPQPGCPGT